MLAPGTPIRVRDDWPEARGPCHIRTPHYLRGHTGTVIRHLGRFPNPEDLAFARPAPRLDLYHVAFRPTEIWPAKNGVAENGLAENGPAEAGPARSPSGDEILVELFEPWLEPVP